MKQHELEKLEKAVKRAEDPLDIVNAFIKRPIDVPMMDEYWQHRICCLAEMIIRNRK